MRKEKISFSMLLDSKLYNRLSRESKKLKVSKVKIVSHALRKLFESKDLDIE